MTMTLWRITKSVAIFDDGRRIGWDSRGTRFVTTKNDDEEDQLAEAIADQNGGDDLRVSAARVFEVPTYEIPAIVEVLALTLPSKEAV